MQYPSDTSRCLAALDQDTTLIAVIEMSLSTWLVAGVVPGIERQPLKKLAAGTCSAQAAASLALRSRKGRAENYTHSCGL